MDLDELRAFLAVAEAGSFSGASKSTGVVRSTLARRIESMERRLRVRLLVSSDQGIELTERGRLLASHGPRVLAEAQAVETAILERPSEIAGTIRCLIPPGAHHLGTAHISARVNARFPQIAWQFETHSSPIDGLAAGKAGLAIHWGLHPPEGPWKPIRLHELPIRLLANREYLDKHGTPISLDELIRHDMLLWSSSDFPPGHLPLRGGGMHPVSAKAVSGDVMILYQMARQGDGIVLMPFVDIPGDTWARDEAELVLPETVGTDISVWLVAPHALADTEAVRAIVEESVTFLDRLSCPLAAAPRGSGGRPPGNKLFIP